MVLVGELVSRSWWGSTAVLCLRQGVQTALPMLVVLAVPGRVLRWADLVAVAGAVAVTVVAAVVRAVRGAQDTTPLGMAVRAGVGVLAGLGVTDVADLARVDWRAAAVAAVVAMVASLVHVQVDPPGVPLRMSPVDRVPLW